MVEPDDKVLVERVLAGDQNAFETVVERYQKPVYNIALRLMQDRDEAEEVAQATFVKAFENLQRFDVQRKFFSWLYRIAINESLTALGRLQRHARMDEVAERETASADAEMESEEAAEQVVSALMELKVNQRTVIVLKHLQNLSYEEISQILDIPVRKVKS